MSSDQKSASPSKVSNNSSDVRLYERVRLQSFQSLLHGSPGRLRSPTGKHPRVLLEDLLKAEVLSSQLVLAIEDLVKSLQGMLDHPGQAENGEDYGMSSTTEDESIKSFRSALAQSANTLDELTKLQISENGGVEVKTMGAVQKHGSSGLSPNTTWMAAEHGPIYHDENSNKQRLHKISYGSDSTTPGEKSSLSARASEFSSSASPSDVTACEEDTSGEEEARGRGEGDAVTCLQDAVKTLCNEIHDLQAKHEVQFMTFASKCMELDQDDHRNMRRILERIIQKLTPQDQNWTFHGRLDETEMEQLFYFVLLQKTLKSCLAVINGARLDEIDRKTERENTHLHENKEVKGRRDFESSLSNGSELCSHCGRATTSFSEIACSKTNESYPMYGKRTAGLDVPKNDTQYINSSDSGEEAAVNGSCLSKSNGKRLHDFEDEHESKKRKKGKSLFACFTAKWPRRNKRSKNK